MAACRRGWSRRRGRGSNDVPSKAPGEEIRSRLDHPVLDADGHTLEFGPLLSDYLREDGVADDLAGVFEGMPIFSTRWRDLSPEERVRTRAYRSVWWWHPTAEHAGSGHRLSPGAAVPAVGRARDRLLHRVSVDRVDVPSRRPRRSPSWLVPQPQPLSRGAVQAVCRPHAAGRGHPHAHPRRGDGGTGPRRRGAGVSCRDPGRLRQA